MRHEIGIDNIAFGRDYPHPEGTWPNTSQWISDAFAGVPEDEVRLMLGENVIRFLRLDRSALARIAERVGPSMRDLTAAPTVDPALVAHFDRRGGYLKAAEDGSNLETLSGAVRQDLTLLVP
jgi:hypothetical protein